MKLVLVLLFPILIQAQKMPDAGELLTDSSFTCIDKIQPDSFEFGVREICNSENYLEIRLKTSIMASSELIIFSFNNNEWQAEKYYFEYITKRKKIVSVIPKKEIKKDSAGFFNKIFDSLKLKSFFQIPDQKTVIKRTSSNGGLVVTDGVLYTISYKANKLYRRYWYGNPITYAEHFPMVNEYKQVVEIVNLLNSIF